MELPRHSHCTACGQAVQDHMEHQQTAHAVTDLMLYALTVIAILFLLFWIINTLLQLAGLPYLGPHYS